MSDPAIGRYRQAPSGNKPGQPRSRARCAICGKDAKHPIAFGMIRPALAAMIAAEHPGLHGGFCNLRGASRRLPHANMSRTCWSANAAS